MMHTVKIVENFVHQLTIFCSYMYYICNQVGRFSAFIFQLPNSFLGPALKQNLHLRAKCLFLKLSKTLHSTWQFLFLLMKSCKWGQNPPTLF